MNDIIQIRIGGSTVGIIGLEEVFEKVRGEDLADLDALSSRLLEEVAGRNYIAPGLRDEYAKALLREYRRFLGEDVTVDERRGLEIRVLGAGCPRCEHLTEEVLSVLAERDIEADLEHIKDVGKIGSYGPVATPALVINGKVVTSGRVPARAKIVQLIEENLK
jgi:small redox-active disulfide protein 2